MQFIYMCRDGENEELRYSIRSVLSFFPDADIWVIGGKPSWYVGNHILIKQNSSKYANVKKNIEKLISDQRINDSFVYMNDDFYLTDLPDFSFAYHRGTLNMYLEENRECCSQYMYYKLMNRTANKVKKISGDSALNYELHIPILISKHALAKSYYKADLWRSFYGNYFKIGGTEIQDCKVYESDVKNKISLDSFINEQSPFLSSSDKTFNFVLDNYLKNRFPDKTHLEN